MDKGEPNTVLLVDDDEEVRHVLRLLFDFEGFVVTGEAGTGAEALPHALRHQPTFIVLDHMLPGLRGDETAEILREVAPDSRIVAFSAMLAGKPDWADAYLNKDRISEIVPELRALLQRDSDLAGHTARLN